MPKYEVIIYWSKEDQSFLAEVPELSGCMSDGATYRKALANLEVVMKLWIETAKKLDRPIPQARKDCFSGLTAAYNNGTHYQ